MHRWFYSIGVFLLLCLFSFAGYNYHQVNVLRAQVQQIQEKQEETDNRAEVSEETKYVETAAEEGGYYLVEENGVVSVYQADRITLYETTGISLDMLPVKLQEEIKAGKYVKSELELYSFLENYSS
ncbi:MAG: hypothetical protein Q4F24_00980 [Eubacteriales bacterium]|nr:hypothetical protein [Eubacteriales bacterium]